MGSHFYYCDAVEKTIEVTVSNLTHFVRSQKDKWQLEIERKKKAGNTASPHVFETRCDFGHSNIIDVILFQPKKV